MDTKLFELTADHLELLQRMRVGWTPREFGAPSIDCKRPYGNSSVYEDMADILGVDGFENHRGEIHFSEEQVTRFQELHEETETALQIVLSTGQFKTGVYETEKSTSDWERVGDLESDPQ